MQMPQMLLLRMPNNRLMLMHAATCDGLCHNALRCWCAHVVWVLVCQIRCLTSAPTIFPRPQAERTLEPLALAAGDAPPLSLQRADPRVQRNLDGHVPFQVAHRLGYVTLALLLR